MKGAHKPTKLPRCWSSDWGNQQFYMEDDLPHKQPLLWAKLKVKREESWKLNRFHQRSK